MKVTVNPQSKKFQLATTEGWVECRGHEIKIGEVSFSACPITQGILVSEVSTGMKVKIFNYNFLTGLICQTKEGTLSYFETFIAPALKDIVEKLPDIKMLLEGERKRIEQLGIGDMPPIEDNDDSLITAPISEIKH